MPFDESSLCRLFLLASSRNYEGYKIPGIENLQRHRELVIMMLQIDPRQRPTPPQFIDYVLKGKPLRKSVSTPNFPSESHSTTLGFPSFPSFIGQRLNGFEMNPQPHFDLKGWASDALELTVLFVACNYCLFNYRSLLLGWTRESEKKKKQLPEKPKFSLSST